MMVEGIGGSDKTVSEFFGNRNRVKRCTICRVVFWIIVCLVFGGFACAGHSEGGAYRLDDIVVTGSATPVELSRSAWSTTVIDREDIAAMPVDNVADLLETVTGVDVRQRGGLGVQADVSIRGGSFEETLILVDGINVSDAQTGHHNMNLPVNLDDIERIEILKGPGALVYGHNAMTGVINIITRKVERTEAGAGGAGGQNGFYRLDGRVQGKTGQWANRLSASQRRSPGYIETGETDFDIRTVSYSGGIDAGGNRVKLGLGYTENDFGAYGFYSDVYPDQREKTGTFLAHGAADLAFGAITVSPKAFWRRNHDDFGILITDAWLKNNHRSDSYGMSAGMTGEGIFGTTALGAETVKEVLESSGLGDHDRNRQGLFFEQKYSPVERITIGAGASAMKYTRWGWEYWPGADFQIELTPGTIGFASGARSYRVPTYTEMYYNNAANKGNPDLRPEKAWTYEIGVRRFENAVKSSASLFYRDSENLIDWTRETGKTTWEAQNISQSIVRGVELGLDLDPDQWIDVSCDTMVNLSYTFLDADFNADGLESKYVLDQLRHQVNGTIRVNWSAAWSQTLKARYEKRMVSDSHVSVDTRLAFCRNDWELFCDITNITDSDYVDNGFAPAPGRWIIAGVSVDFL